MFCRNCGSRMDAEDRFCRMCGRPTNAVEVRKEPLFGDTVKMKKRKKKGGKSRLIVLLLLLLLALGGGILAIRHFTSDEYKVEKNLKLAQKAYEAEDFEAAKEHYTIVLEYQPVIYEEAYLRIAEIYLKDGQDTEAIKILRKGIFAVTSGDGTASLLKNKIEMVYLTAIRTRYEEESYSEALKLLDEAFADLNKPEFRSKKKQVYQKMMEASLINEDYEGALEIVQQAYKDIDDEDFRLKRLEILEWGYFEQIDNCLSNEEYEEALQIAENARKQLRSETFQEKKVDIYIQWAEWLIESEEYVEAWWVLADARWETEEESILIMIEELEEKYGVSISGGGSSFHYNENGQE